MDLVLCNGRHFWIPAAYQLVVLFNFVGLDIVEHDRMDVFAARQNLRKASLDIFVKLTALRRSIDERRQSSTLLLAAFLLTGASFF